MRKNLDFERSVRNGSKYKTEHNYKIKREELRLADPKELHPMTEVFYNCQSEQTTSGVGCHLKSEGENCLSGLLPRRR